ncbi:YdaU family protein [Microvirga sesbaniae]|uniref:YdaU family protein n=1 Tax=Microvirga sesbaniae TaxID=681392 RepID=UPI0021C92658|nr:YdaU family protein [Microvirga sp. HBU67692]
MKGEFYRMEYEAWDEGTDALTLEQEAAYLRLCHQMYRRRGAVPDNPATLARLWRCHPNKARKLLGDLLALGKVTRTEGGLANARVARELHHRGIASAHRAEAGRTGGLRSGETRRKSLTGHDPDEAPASSGANQRREEKSREEPHHAEGPETSQQPPALDDRTLEAALREAAGFDNDPSPGLFVVGPVHALMAEGYDLDRHILPVVRSLKAQGKRWSSWRYIVPAVREHKAGPAAPGAASAPEDPARIRRGLLAMARGFVLEERWSDAWGPRRGEPGCRIPDAVWREADDAADAERAAREERRRAAEPAHP